MKIQKRQAGFTLVELITVVSLVALLVVYITVELGQSNDDAKVAMTTAFILGSIPKAASSYKARNFGSCALIDDATEYTASGATYPAAAGAGTENPVATAAKKNLVERGLYQKTPWDDYWSVTYTDTTRLLTVSIPTTGSDNPTQAARDIIKNVTGKPQIDTVTDYNSASDVVIVTYHCS